MDNTYTHISVVVDRSGSMSAHRSDAEGAVNFFLSEQKKVEGKATVYLVDFDTEDAQHVVHEGDLQSAPRYRLSPRGSTPLHDAVGQAIARTGDYLSFMPEAERPAKVVFVIQTDGLENASKEWTTEKVKEAIKTQHETYGWEFVFLGMGPETWDQAKGYGITNVTRSAGTGVAYDSSHQHLNNVMSQYRGGHVHSMVATNSVVNEHGQVFDADGNEIDPKTGTKITSSI